MSVIVDRAGLDGLIAVLRRRGYTVIGPQIRSRAIVYGELTSARELAAGVEDVQEGGTYRLREREDGALFAHTVGHDSVKRFLFPPVLPVWRARRDAGGTLAVEPPPPPPRYVFLGDRYVDGDYEARRRDAFFVAVNCARAGGTCFCTSMGTGPHVTAGYDLALTELLDDGGHRFLVEVGSDRGRDILAELPARPAEPVERRAAREQTERTAGSMGRSLDTDGIRELLQDNAEHPRWDDVADRCL